MFDRAILHLDLDAFFVSVELLLIPAGTKRDFLAPLAVGKMPSIGKETERKLAHLGVRTIGQLAAMPPALLEREFGKHGLHIWKRAKGKTTAPCCRFTNRKVSRQSVPFIPTSAMCNNSATALPTS